MSPQDANEELARAKFELRKLCDIALLTSLPNITHVSGFHGPCAAGVIQALAYAGPFAAVPVQGGISYLGVPVFDAKHASEESRLDNLLAFDMFDSFQPTDQRESYLEALRTALHGAGLRSGVRLGIETRTLPHVAAQFITNSFAHITFVEIGEALARARLVKTAREIELLRRATAISTTGHRKLTELVRTPGQNELDMFAEVVAAIVQATGRGIAVEGELITGPRTAITQYPGGPQDRVTEPGDGVIMDISQAVAGYWSDCTNTHVVSEVEPTSHQKRFVRVSQDAFYAAVDMLRPGRCASDAWSAAEAVHTKAGMRIPHYMGHGIGVTVNEAPWLVSYDHTVIETNMVFAVESGCYEGPGGTFGARSEKLVLVTDSGPEIMSQFEWGIAPQ